MNEVSKELKCISMRNGVEIWAEKERLEKLQNSLVGIKESKFVFLDEQMLNTADIVGIFDAKTMEEVTHRKNGQWKCEYNNWHNRGTKCEDCLRTDIMKRNPLLYAD